MTLTPKGGEPIDGFRRRGQTPHCRIGMQPSRLLLEILRAIVVGIKLTDSRRTRPRNADGGHQRLTSAKRRSINGQKSGNGHRR
jgi:hypothetical protein